VLLVPLSTALILDRLVVLLLAALDRLGLPHAWIALPLAAGLIGLCVYRGIEFQRLQIDNYRFQKVAQAFNYVEQTRQPGDIYLVPPMDAEFDDFRLQTGAPVYITWKSHPYQDVEVLEWYRRVQAVNRFFQAPDREACPILHDLATQEGITHVVLKGKDSGLACDFVKETFRLNRFSVYEITP
jgi:hypothetical protein